LIGQDYLFVASITITLAKETTSYAPLCSSRLENPILTAALARFTFIIIKDLTKCLEEGEFRLKDLQQYVIDLPLHNQVFFALVETTAQLVDVSESYWQAQGVNGARIRILVELMKDGGTLLPSKLAQKIGVTKANISLLLGPLEKDGLIRREPHLRDGRKSVITITGQGQSLLLQHLPRNRERIAERMSVLDEAELNQLQALLQKLKRA